MDWPRKVSTIIIISMTMMMMTMNPTRAQNAARDFVRAHNRARAKVGVPPLVWNRTLAAYAQSYADQRSLDCAMQHSGGPYGENLAAGSWDLTANEAVGMWVDEKSFYNVGSNACVVGEECRHYTQVVWRNTIRIGCGRARCSDGWTFVTCNYDPPGNYIGERPFVFVDKFKSFTIGK